MSERRQFVMWFAVAAIALLLLVVVLVSQQKGRQRRWAVLFPPQPVEGKVVFREKGCANCHGETAAGSNTGPGLRQRASLASLPQLVTAMWNHAPRMWEAFQAQKVPYPDLSYEETAEAGLERHAGE